MNISVVIPNYNGVHLFLDTLPALFNALKYSGKQYEVIVIDDCSVDKSINYLQENYPAVIILRNEINSGFSATINKGIFAAKYELILLLNSDVKLTERYFENQFGYFSMPDTFGVMGKIVGWDDDLIQDGAKYPKFEGFKLKTSLNYLPDSSSDQLAYSMYLSGANALIDREKLLKLSGFDELYSPFYMEDVDLSVRAWRMGWNCYFEPMSVCRHKTSTSIATKEKRNFVRKIYNRNKMYFHAIHLHGFSLTGWHIQTFLELLLRMVTFRWDYVKSFIAFVRTYKKWMLSRSAFERLAEANGTKRSLDEIVELLHQSAINANKTFFKS